MAELGNIPPKAELAAVGEVRIGEARTANANTIINDEALAEGLLNRMPITGLSPADQQEMQNNPESEQTAFDLVIATIQGLISRIIGNDSDDSLLSDEEVDQLSVFPGNSIESYIRELKQGGECIPQDDKLSLLRFLLEDDNFIEWERRCRKLMKPVTLNSPLIKQMDNYRAKLRAYLGSWSHGPEHCSPNIYLLDNQLTAHRIPAVNQTDAIRGKMGVSTGVHAWDIKIMGPVGTNCSVGIAMREAPLVSRTGYASLIGANEHSYGWDLAWGNLIHKGKILGDYPPNHIYDYSPGDTVRIILDCDKGTLSYAVNEMSFGKAFENLKKEVTFYPAISLVYGNIEASLMYLGPPPPLRNDADVLSEKK